LKCDWPVLAVNSKKNAQPGGAAFQVGSQDASFTVSDNFCRLATACSVERPEAPQLFVLAAALRSYGGEVRMRKSAGRPFYLPVENMPSRLRVLILDRSPAGAEPILRELRRSGYHCQAHVVTTRSEFIACLREFGYDIVLSDYHLTDWTGMDALTEMRHSGRECPFILVTEMLGEEAAVECIKQGVTDYVLKDHLARLPAVVARALEERSLRDTRSFMVEALQQSEASFRFLFDHNPFPMFVLDRESLLLYQANDAAVRNYGYGQPEFMQMRFGDLHPPEEVSRLVRHLREKYSDARPAGPWRHRLKGGDVIDVELFPHPMEYKGHPAALVVAQDITERRALERQLQHAQKFEAIGQLAGGIAHDFNNVIGAILGWSELGEVRASPKDEDLASYFKKIHVQCARAAALTRQLLAFARRQILEPRNLNLNQSVHEVLSLLDKVIGKDIEINRSLADDLTTVRADPTHIEQVLTNLCINSRDAMPNGGTLSIGTRNVEFTREECSRNSGLQPGRFVELLVRDTGIGMDSAVRERIFEPFFTTKETGKGTGLGLATVYGIVKQHGGFILVESEPNRGSAFRILLPVHDDTAVVDRRSPVPESHPVRGGKETILIAEDDEGVGEMACATLESLGYKVLRAQDGAEAVEMFSANQDSIALVILDVIMPRRGGREAYAAITALKPEVPVMFATGYTNEIGALTEMLTRGITILQKPYSPTLLGKTIREVLDHAVTASYLTT
jgi:two-component system cell cycle sensor histidine kinase/response regulator CckA